MRGSARWTLAALVGVIVLGCVFSADGAFFRWAVHRDLLRAIAVDGILALGTTVVVLTGGIDLSVGSAVALAAVGFATLSLQLEAPGALAVAAVAALGTALGAASGWLVGRGLQPFVVTLASMVSLRGLAKWVAGGRKVTGAVTGADGATVVHPRPALWEWLDDRVLYDQIAVVTLVFLALALAVHGVLSRTAFGRHLRAIGGNEEAARLAGVPVAGTRVAAYALCGLLAAIAGVLQAAQETHGDPDTAAGKELDAIAMVVLGGTSLRGGTGSVPATLAGVLILGLLHKILSLNAVPEAARLVATGAVVLGAVWVQRRGTR